MSTNCQRRLKEHVRDGNFVLGQNTLQIRVATPDTSDRELRVHEKKTIQLKSKMFDLKNIQHNTK